LTSFCNSPYVCCTAVSINQSAIRESVRQSNNQLPMRT
jgi:hypothetical protein